MDLDRFWQLIDSSRNADDPLPTLGLALEELTREELIGFQRQLENVHAQATRADLRGAAYLAGAEGAEGLSNFCYGLIAQGRALFEAALEDPDCLADHDIELFSDDLFGYVACEVYESSYGEALPAGESTVPGAPGAEEWDFEDPDAWTPRFPKLWEKYG